MSKFASVISLTCILLSCAFLPACSKSSSTNVVTNPVPASVDLCLSPSSSCAGGLNVSLEVGQSQVLTATARNAANQILNETYSFQSSNSAVLTIASNGIACAGTWDSLTTPQVCTPGPTGITQITATAQGVSSPPVTVYVHQHITSITISKVPNQPPTLSSACFSKGAPSGPESVLYQAFAFNGAADITSTVGPFSWQTVLVGGQTTSAVTLSSPPGSAPLNQEVAIASAPGMSLIFTAASGIHSQPVPFVTCPVQSISISALGNPAATSFVVNTGTSTTLNATVTDSLGMTLVGVPLTWSSTNPISVSVSGATNTIYGSVGTASAAAIGGGAVIASCTPPSCNGGINPSLPIYPQAAISFTVESTSNPTSPTVYVSSTGCSTTTATCNTTIVPITKASSSSAFTPGSPVTIPFTPNSIVFDDRGTYAYLGVESSAFGSKSLMTFTGSAASQVSNVAGKVLAVSPDTTVSVISDATDLPNQVFICTACNSANSHTTASFLITGATAAAFSPDSLKAYIVAGSNLYIYSKVDALQTKSLGATANDVAFFPEGAFSYLAGGAASAVTVRRTCDNSLDPAATVPTAAPPILIRALPDAATVVVLDPPNLELINVSPNGTWAGCTPSVNDIISNTFNLGQGSFTPTQFIISPDGSAAYILGEAVPSQQSVVDITAVSQSGSNTTYSYTLTSGPALQVGMRIVVTGMQNLSDNGAFAITALNPANGAVPATFTVVNGSGINATGENGTGTVTPRFPFIIVFHLSAQTSSNISLAGNAVPLSASLSPAGDMLFVGADDGAVHVIDTAAQTDTQQISFPFPQNALCFGPGNPATQPPVTCLPDLVVVKP